MGVAFAAASGTIILACKYPKFYERWYLVPQQWYSGRQAGERLSLSYTSTQRYITAGLLPTMILGGPSGFEPIVLLPAVYIDALAEAFPRKDGRNFVKQVEAFSEKNSGLSWHYERAFWNRVVALAEANTKRRTKVGTAFLTIGQFSEIVGISRNTYHRHLEHMSSRVQNFGWPVVLLETIRKYVHWSHPRPMPPIEEPTTDPRTYPKWYSPTEAAGKLGIHKRMVAYATYEVFALPFVEVENPYERRTLTRWLLPQPYIDALAISHRPPVGTRTMKAFSQQAKAIELLRQCEAVFEAAIHRGTRTSSEGIPYLLQAEVCRLLGVERGFFGNDRGYLLRELPSASYGRVVPLELFRRYVVFNHPNPR